MIQSGKCTQCTQKTENLIWLYWLPWQSLFRVSPYVQSGLIVHMRNSSIQTTRAWRWIPYVRYPIPGDHLPVHAQQLNQNEQEAYKLLLQRQIEDGCRRSSTIVGISRNNGNYTTCIVSYDFIGVFAYNYRSIQINHCTTLTLSASRCANQRTTSKTERAKSTRLSNKITINY